MRAERIPMPLGPYPIHKFPRCEGIVGKATQKWRDHMGHSYRCKMGARFIVDSKPYCERCAGRKCLEYIMEQSNESPPSR